MPWYTASALPQIGWIRSQQFQFTLSSSVPRADKKWTTQGYFLELSKNGNYCNHFATRCASLTSTLFKSSPTVEFTKLSAEVISFSTTQLYDDYWWIFGTIFHKSIFAVIVQTPRRIHMKLINTKFQQSIQETKFIKTITTFLHDHPLARSPFCGQ